MKKFLKVVKEFPKVVKKFPKNFKKFHKFVKEFPKVVKKFCTKSRSPANLSKMNQKETMCPKIDKVDHDIENLVEQIEQNEL